MLTTKNKDVLRVEFKFNVAIRERKAPVKVIGKVFNTGSTHMGISYANYEVGYFTIAPNGAVKFDEEINNEEIT